MRESIALPQQVPQYIGDLSRQDALLLAALAGRAEGCLLEFGAGGSTQIFAATAPPLTQIVSIETDPAWVETTKANLRRLEIRRPVAFLDYKDWRARMPSQVVSLVFNDGIDKKRLEFALASWPLLAFGGTMLFHDTRRRKDFRNVLAFCAKAFLEIASVDFNAFDSNLTMITKTAPRPWVDWNVVEGRERWEYGHEEPPPDFRERWARRHS